MAVSFKRPAGGLIDGVRDLSVHSAVSYLEWKERRKAQPDLQLAEDVKTEKFAGSAFPVGFSIPVYDNGTRETQSNYKLRRPQQCRVSPDPASALCLAVFSRGRPEWRTALFTCPNRSAPSAPMVAGHTT